MKALRSLVVAGGHRAVATVTAVERHGTEILLVVDGQPHAQVWWASGPIDQEGLILLTTRYLTGQPAGGAWEWPTPTAPTGGAA